MGTVEDLRRMKSGREVKQTTHLHLVSGLRMREAIPPVPNTSWWLGA